MNNWSWNLFFGVASEDGRWEFGSIIDGEAAAWNSGASAPDTGWVGVAFTFGRVLSFAFIRSFSNRFSDIVVELINSFLGSDLDLWSLLLLFTGEDSSWKLGGISNREAAAWNSGAFAPSAGWVGIATI